MSDFNYATDADGIATITWDMPGRSMNVLTIAGLEELSACVERALGDESVKGVVITSAKKDCAGGMDLNVIAQMKDAAGDDPARGVFDGIM